MIDGARLQGAPEDHSAFKVEARAAYRPNGAGEHAHDGYDRAAAESLGRVTSGDAPPQQPAPAPIRATPWSRRDPRTIPARQWLYGKHYVRSFVSTTIAPGGVGKSSLIFAEAVSMTSGIALLGGPAPKPLRVWVWNGEDPIDEIDRRVAAVLIHYRLDPEQIGDRLYLDSGRSTPLIIATKHRDNVVIAEPVTEGLIREIRERRIDVMVIDPFVSSHHVPENDNPAIDRVAKTWARIADATGCSIELVHHVRKPGNGGQVEYTVDDARGGSALIGAVREARLLNVMSKDEAEKAQIPPEQRRSYFRIDDGKGNMRPPLEKAIWHRLVGTPLDNRTDEGEGDWVGVVTSWEMPGTFEGVSATDLRAVQHKIAGGQWAENIQAGNWAGHAVAEVLALDSNSAGGKQRIKTMLAAWLANKALRIERQHSARDGREKPMIVVGEWA